MSGKVSGLLLGLLCLVSCSCNRPPERKLQNAELDRWVEACSAEKLAEQLEAGSDPNAPVAGRNLLVSFAKSNCREAVRVLLEKGASVSPRDENGISAMEYAIISANWRMASDLLEFGENPIGRTSRGDSYLEFAHDFQRYKIELLLRKGFPSGLKAEPALSKLESAVFQGQLQAVKVGSLQENRIQLIYLAASLGEVDILHYLLSNANDKEMGQLPTSAIQEIVASEEPTTLSILLDDFKRRGIDAPGLEQGLLAAVTSEDLNAVRILLKTGVDLNSPVGPRGWTVLHQAVEREDVQTVKLLLEHGADPKMTTNDGYSSYDLMRRSNSSEIRSLAP